MDTNQLWKTILGELELSISKANFTTWFKGTYILKIDENTIYIGVPNTFTKAWLEKKFYDLISNTLKKHYDKFEKIEFIVSPKKQINSEINNILENKQNNILQNKQNENQIISPFNLNSKYLFENFIVGKCNELAHAAARAVAEKPGNSYNPLFIYGGVGLGKTHLLQAIGNHIKKTRPNFKILYISCEKFTSDFVNAIKNNKVDKFKKTYRKVDLLLMDDVQFLAGKEATQEEFFHTFNELYQNNRQLVVTSDRPPKAIPELESRLLSRFEWGMIADVAPIDYETRIAIIQSKSKEKGLNFDKDTIDFIARTIHTNVREIEGALNRIKAHIDLQNLKPELNIVKNILSTITNLPRKESITTKLIIKTVSQYFNIKEQDLLGKSRQKDLVYPRQIAMFLIREELQASYPVIGKELGGRDHTTAMHACQKIAKDLNTNEKVRQDFNLIKQRLFSRTN